LANAFYFYAFANIEYAFAKMAIYGRNYRFSEKKLRFSILGKRLYQIVICYKIRIL